MMAPRTRMQDSGGTLRTILKIQQKDATGTVRVIQRIRVMVGGALQTVFQFLSVTLNRDLVTGSYGGASPAAQNISTSTVSGTVSGGTAPFTYIWAEVGTPSYTWTIGTATAVDTLFTGLSIPNGADDSNLFTLTVTDANGNVTVSEPVTATVTNNSTA